MEEPWKCYPNKQRMVPKYWQHIPLCESKQLLGLVLPSVKLQPHIVSQCYTKCLPKICPELQVSRNKYLRIEKKNGMVIKDKTKNIYGY